MRFATALARLRAPRAASARAAAGARCASSPPLEAAAATSRSYSSSPEAHNLAALLRAKGELDLVTWPLPRTPPANCVRIAIQAVGICASDLHYLKHGRIGRFVVEPPGIILGHESAGYVVALGEGVTRLSVGDRVAIEPGVSCFHHHIARTGRYNLDPDIVFCATPPHHGSLSTYYDHPASFCHLLPSNVTLEQGALCEPLSVALHALRRSKAAGASTLAVLGAGPIGLLVCAAAKAQFRALRVAVTDLRPSNLELAKKVGADFALLSAFDELPDLLSDRLATALGGPPEVVIDCVGVAATLEGAVESVQVGGNVVVVGLAGGAAPLDIAELVAKELTVRGSFRYANTYPTALRLVSQGLLDPSALVTHRESEWSAAGLRRGFERALGLEAIKVVFTLGC